VVFILLLADALMTDIYFDYKNWRGETATRHVRPIRIWFGSTQYHPTPQWLLTAVDLDKNAERDFAMADMSGWCTRVLP